MQQQIEETHASFDLRSHPQSKTIPEVYKAYRADISIQRPIYACTICRLYWCVSVFHAPINDFVRIFSSSEGR